jgi:regulator of sigma E protease
VVVKGFSHGFGPGMLWSFEIMALISVSLALLNLLPIPVLDGGQTLLFLTEIIRGKPTNPRSVYRYQIVGTIIVLIIFIGATMNDFMHLRNR